MKRPRLLLLLVLGILLVAGALAYRRFRFARPVGEGPAGPAVAREAFARPWTEREVLLLAVGDSVTAGYGVRHSHSYVGRLPVRLFGADLDNGCLHLLEVVATLARPRMGSGPRRPSSRR
jgi:hypothetical protein